MQPEDRPEILEGRLAPSARQQYICGPQPPSRSEDWGPRAYAEITASSGTMAGLSMPTLVSRPLPYSSSHQSSMNTQFLG